MDMPNSPPRHMNSPASPSSPEAGGANGVLSAFTGTFRRVRDLRPVTMLLGAFRTASAGGLATNLERRQREPESPPDRRIISLVPRPGALAGSVGGSGGGTATSPTQKHGGRGRAVPVSTTKVQDGVKWVNLVRFVNLAKLFTPCLRPRNRRRVRFGTSPTQRALLMTSSGGCDNTKPTADQAAGGIGATSAGLCNTKPIYIQVRQGRHLVWPSFEGVEHSCFCLLLVGNQPRGSTQAVPVSSSGHTASNAVQWNEVFSFPRSILEGTSDARVQFQVWSSEQFGDDVLVGQADLLLGPMLAADQPHPLTTVLELQAIDDDTGQVEPGICGEVVVAAWVEPEADTARVLPTCLPTSHPADLHEAGVITSNLSAPCGSKSMPQVVHSPLGTLYEEPCVVVLKMSVVGLVNLNYELLVTSAQQGGITKRRVRLEGVLRSNSNVRDRRKEGLGGAMPPSFGMPGLASSPAQPPPPGMIYASASMKKGMGTYLARARMDRKHRQMMKQLQKASLTTLDGKAPGFTASGEAGCAPGCLPMLTAGAFGGPRPRGHSVGSAGGAPPPNAAAGANVLIADELNEEDDEVSLTVSAGGAGGSGGAGDDGRPAPGDDGDDASSSIALNPTAPLIGMAHDDATTVTGQGQGVFCYFKVSVDKQSDKSRLRWLAAPLAGLQLAADSSAVTLQPSVFVFSMPRPLNNSPVGLALYITTSARRRGRVVGRVLAPLYDILDQVLGQSSRPGEGLSGKPVEVVLPFEEPELGAVRMIVQLADLDERAALFHMPLVSEPQQLLFSEGQYGCSAGLYGPAVVPVDGGAAVRHTAGALGPVLSDTPLLQRVLERSGVDADVGDWFFNSYARVGSLKVAGMGGLQDGVASPFNQMFSGSNARSAAATASGVRAMSQRIKGCSDPAALTAAIFDEDAARGAPLDSLFGDFANGPSPFVEERNNNTPLPGILASGGGGAGAAAGTAAPHVLGSLVLRISSINSSGALVGSSSCCCIVKCGPHWLRTVDRLPSEGAGGLPQWQVVIPLYSPATILTVGIFTNSAKSVMGLTFSDNLVLVSRVRLKLNSVRPFRRSWHVIAMYMNGATGAASAAGPPLVGVLGLKMQYSSVAALAASYLMAPAPESLYELDLETDVALKMETDARKISENWLGSAQPPIPPQVARLLLDDGRTTFNFARTKNNWRRVKSGMRLMFDLVNWFSHIISWTNRRDSLEVVFCIALLCYLPSMACKLFFYMIALRGHRSFFDYRKRNLALAEGGADEAAALLISPTAAAAAAAGGGGAAAVAAATAAAAAAATQGAREAVGTIGDMTIGGGVVDEGSDDEVGENSKVAVGTVAEFKRKFAELIELGLLLQNLFDDVASILERLQAVMAFHDVLASGLFILACLLLVCVVALLGFQTTVFLFLLWQVRPPSLRDALPPPPFSYFLKLPCKSSAEFG